MDGCLFFSFVQGQRLSPLSRSQHFELHYYEAIMPIPDWKRYKTNTHTHTVIALKEWNVVRQSPSVYEVSE